MAVTNFIPQVWSARLLAHLDKAHVLTNLVNRDYEGEIRQYGDTVKITQIGDITIKDYVTNTDIDDPQELTTEQQLLVIDQQKYYAFQIDDVDASRRAAAGGPAFRPAVLPPGVSSASRSADADPPSGPGARESGRRGHAARGLRPGGRRRPLAGVAHGRGRGRGQPDRLRRRARGADGGDRLYLLTSHRAACGGPVFRPAVLLRSVLGLQVRWRGPSVGGSR